MDLHTLEVLPEGMVNEDVDLNMKVELEDEDDPLDDWYLIPYYHNYISVNMYINHYAFARYNLMLIMVIVLLIFITMVSED